MIRTIFPEKLALRIWLSPKSPQIPAASMMPMPEVVATMPMEMQTAAGSCFFP